MSERRTPGADAPVAAVATDVGFRRLFEAAPDLFLVVKTDADFTIQGASDAYLAATMTRREEIVGRPLFDAFPDNPADAAATGVANLRASLERVVTTRRGDAMATQRYDIRRRRGAAVTFEERYWTAVNAPLPGPDGRAAYVINRVEEVTSYVQQLRSVGAGGGRSAADQVEAAEAELFLRAQELEETNRRLRRARARERRATDAARAALNHQRQAVADTSHDLRRPLTGLQTRLQEALADPQVDSQKVLHAALHDAERLGDIVGDLLELARLEGGAPFPTEPVDLSALVAAEVERAGPACRTAVDVAPGITVEGSPVRLARVLANLLGNADRHADSLIEVKAGVREGEAVVEVIDDGPGIPAQEREAVFQRFYRRADARRSDPEGTGLGLPIARQIARAHHGDLHIADHPHGTRMLLRLPSTSP